jgi:hypothetical protein
MLFSTLAISPVLGATAAALGVAGVRRASSGLDHVRFAPLAVTATTGAALCLAIPLLRSGEPFEGIALPLLLACAGALLAALAHVDRATAWAPDALMLPAVAAVFGLGSASGALPLDLAWALASGVIVFLASQIAWLATHRLIPGVPPPADLLAMLLPLPVLGLSPATVAFYLSISLIIFAYRISPGVRRVFSVPEAIRAASRDIGASDVDDAAAAPFLALSAPVALLLFAFFLPFPPHGGGW